MKKEQRGFPNGLLLTGDDHNALSESRSGDVLRFLPNLSVYVLPPDTVCLYSEHRKFFLHGKLQKPPNLGTNSTVVGGAARTDSMHYLDSYVSDRAHPPLYK